jgi:hypothetical protein
MWRTLGSSQILSEFIYSTIKVFRDLPADLRDGGNTSKLGKLLA